MIASTLRAHSFHQRERCGGMWPCKLSKVVQGTTYSCVDDITKKIAQKQNNYPSRLLVCRYHSQPSYVLVEPSLAEKVTSDLVTFSSCDEVAMLQLFHFLKTSKLRLDKLDREMGRRTPRHDREIPLFLLNVSDIYPIKSSCFKLKRKNNTVKVSFTEKLTLL